MAGNEGFSDEGGRALVQAMKQNLAVQEVGLDACRLNDKTLKLHVNSLSSITDLRKLHVSTSKIKTFKT